MILGNFQDSLRIILTVCGIMFWIVLGIVFWMVWDSHHHHQRGLWFVVSTINDWKLLLYTIQHYLPSQKKGPKPSSASSSAGPSLVWDSFVQFVGQFQGSVWTVLGSIWTVLGPVDTQKAYTSPTTNCQKSYKILQFSCKTLVSTVFEPPPPLPPTPLLGQFLGQLCIVFAIVLDRFEPFWVVFGQVWASFFIVFLQGI